MNTPASDLDFIVFFEQIAEVGPSRPTVITWWWRRHDEYEDG
jgi:hypothetical protein